MVFVEECINDDECEGCEKPAVRQSRARRSTKSARSEVGKNGVLSEVCDLAHDEMDHRKRFGSRVGKKPEDDRANDARCVVGGETIGRGDRDEDQPDDERKVTAKKSAHRWLTAGVTTTRPLRKRLR